MYQDSDDEESIANASEVDASSQGSLNTSRLLGDSSVEVNQGMITQGQDKGVISGDGAASDDDGIRAICVQGSYLTNGVASFPRMMMLAGDSRSCSP